MSFSLDELKSGTGGRILMAERREFPAAGIDSRTLEPGEVFFALPGSRVDGHDYVEAAVAQGAGGAVIAEERAVPELLHRVRRYRNIGLLAVDDVQAALTRAGAHHRSQLGELNVVGITGSNGKTTTKQILGAILAAAGETVVTRGNLNNHLGVPLTLLRLDRRHRYAVVEMGASGPGEIGALARLVRPRVGVITNIAPAHLEGFGSLEGIKKTKGELYRHIAVSGTAVGNLDDANVMEELSKVSGRKLTFSVSGDERADVRATGIAPAGVSGTRFTVHMGGQSAEATLSLPGEHNVANALAATAAASALGILLPDIVAALGSVKPAGMRSEIRVAADGTLFLLDCYNANPTSVVRALQVLAAMEGTGRRIAVLGQMNELGTEAGMFHHSMGVEAAQAGVDWLLYTGKWADQVIEGARAGGLKSAESFPSHEEVLSALGRGMKPGDRVLIKGSRGAQMERIAEPLLRKCDAAVRETTGESVR